MAPKTIHPNHRYFCLGAHVGDSYLQRSRWGFAKQPDGYVELTDRLAAWWNGERFDTGRRTDPAMDIAVDQDLSDQFHEWSSQRVSLCQEVWGTGFITPGTSEMIRKIMAPAQVNAKKSILDISAGMGGTAMYLAREAGAWIDALEPNPSLARQARLLIAGSPVARQINLIAADFSTATIERAKYHLVYSREGLFSTRFKNRMLEQVADGLKMRGQFILTDYMIATENANSQVLEHWLNTEPEDVHPWTLEMYQVAMSDVGLSVVAADDMSDLLASEINEAWQRMLRSLKAGGIDRSHVDHIMVEGEIWQSRLRALASGDLRMIRINALKSPDQKPSIQSNSPRDVLEI